MEGRKRDRGEREAGIQFVERGRERRYLTEDVRRVWGIGRVKRRLSTFSSREISHVVKSCKKLYNVGMMKGVELPVWMYKKESSPFFFVGYLPRPGPYFLPNA